MKGLLVFCVVIGIAYGEIVTTVTVKKRELTYETGDTAVLPCEYTMQPEEQPPTVYWIKGKSVDDPDAEVIFKGYRYWNESLGEYQQFFGNYQKRSTVEDLKEPTIKIAKLTSADEGRYWCMVSEWSGRQQEGTDADSTAVMIGSSKPYVYVTTDESTEVEEGETTSMRCTEHHTYDTVTWYRGPYHHDDQNNFTHTEIGQYEKLGTYYKYNHLGVTMEPGYPRFRIESIGNLEVINADVSDAGRYWCEISYHSATNQELEIDRSSVRLMVTVSPFDCGGLDPGTYPDPEDCSMYYECVDSNPIVYHRSCGYDGLVFDPDNGVCDWAANVEPPCGTSAN